MAKRRDIKGIMGAVKGLVSDTDIGHIHHIPTLGCPAEFNWEEPAEKKEIFICRGKNPSLDKNMEIV